jgi:hypothetical protein
VEKRELNETTPDFDRFSSYRLLEYPQDFFALAIPSPFSFLFWLSSMSLSVHPTPSAAH